jgi:hypothetical protein
MSSFTVKVPDMAEAGPIAEVTVFPSKEFIDAMGLEGKQCKSIKINAMIDTGASSTVIKTGVAALI